MWYLLLMHSCMVTMFMMVTMVQDASTLPNFEKFKGGLILRWSVFTYCPIKTGKLPQKNLQYLRRWLNTNISGKRKPKKKIENRNLKTKTFSKTEKCKPKISVFDLAFEKSTLFWIFINCKVQNNCYMLLNMLRTLVEYSEVTFWLLTNILYQNKHLCSHNHLNLRLINLLSPTERSRQNEFFRYLHERLCDETYNTRTSVLMQC